MAGEASSVQSECPLRGDSQGGPGALSFHLLRGIRDALRQWGEAQQEDVSLVGLGLLKHRVSAMEVVQHPQHPIALVEPGGERTERGGWCAVLFIRASLTFLSPPTPNPSPNMLTTSIRMSQGVVHIPGATPD